MYYTLAGYYLHDYYHSVNINQLINSHELGIKLTENLWLELGALFGQFANFYDAFSEIIYNSMEQYNSSARVSLIASFYKSGISLFATYQYHSSESIFVPSNEPLNYTNNKAFNYQTITGGIIWKF